jgi:hypothetical protein
VVYLVGGDIVNAQRLFNSAFGGRERAPARPTVPHESLPQTGSSSNYCHTSGSRCRQRSGLLSVARLERRFREIPKTIGCLDISLLHNSMCVRISFVSSVRDCTHRISEAGKALQKRMHGSLLAWARRRPTKIGKPAWWPFPKKIRSESRFSEVDFTDSLLVVALG